MEDPVHTQVCAKFDLVAAIRWWDIFPAKNPQNRCSPNQNAWWNSPIPDRYFSSSFSDDHLFNSPIACSLSSPFHNKCQLFLDLVGLLLHQVYGGGSEFGILIPDLRLQFLVRRATSSLSVLFNSSSCMYMTFFVLLQTWFADTGISGAASGRSGWWRAGPAGYNRQRPYRLIPGASTLNEYEAIMDSLPRCIAHFHFKRIMTGGEIGIFLLGSFGPFRPWVVKAGQPVTVFQGWPGIRRGKMNIRNGWFSNCMGFGNILFILYQFSLTLWKYPPNKTLSRHLKSWQTVSAHLNWVPFVYTSHSWCDPNPFSPPKTLFSSTGK